MSKADLIADLKASLNDAAKPFVAANDADFERHLNVAALDLGRKRTRTLAASINPLVADQSGYAPLPAGFVAFKSHLWGQVPIASRKAWEKGYPGPLPRVRLVEEGGVKKLWLDPAPSAAQINAIGPEFRYLYMASHVIDAVAANTTVLDGDRQILILRGQAEAMRELAARNIQKPVTMRSEMGSTPRNGTPAYLYEKLMQEFERVAT